VLRVLLLALLFYICVAAHCCRTRCCDDSHASARCRPECIQKEQQMQLENKDSAAAAAQAAVRQSKKEALYEIRLCNMYALCVRAHVNAAAAPHTCLPFCVLLSLCLPRYLHMCAVLYRVETCNPALRSLSCRRPTFPCSSLTQKIHNDDAQHDEHSCSKSLE
jgi:hypothetical protein